MKKIISCIICMVLIFNLFQYNVNCESSDFSSVTGGYEYIGSGELPSALSYYYIHQGYVHSVPINNAITNIINQRLGTSFKSNWFSNFYSWLIGGTNIALSPLFTVLGSGNLVLNNGTICGLAYENIAGLPYGQNVGSNESISISNQLSNAVYVCLNDYLETESPIVPDYISVGLQTKSYALSHLYDEYGDTSTLYGLINARNGYFTANINTSQQIDTDRNIGIYYCPYNVNFYSYDSTEYNNFCNGFGLSAQKHTLTFNDILNSATNVRLSVACKDKENFTDVYFYNSYQSDVPISSLDILFNYSSPFRTMLFSPNGGYTTIYKNASIIWEMKNKTYTGQDVNFGNNYYNYNTNVNNGYETNNTTINNSPSTNTTVYNEQNQTNNNYYQSIVENTDNTTYIDNSTVNNNNTTIIYNYYSDPENPSPSPSPEPDDPSSPIWETLFSAIVGFFTHLGEIIAAILTGILGLFNSVLDFIADISTDTSALTDFLSSVFGFFPSEIVNLITVSIGLMIVICIIKALK